MRVSMMLLVALAGCDRFFMVDEVPPDAPFPAHCSPMKLLTEDFSAAAFSTYWGAYTMPMPATGTIGVAPVGGELQLAMTSPGYGELHANPYLDLREDSLTVEVPDPGTTAGLTNLFLVAASAPTNRLAIIRNQAVLQFVYAVDDHDSVLAQITYDPAEQRFWRIAQIADATIWSTSRDGIAFTQRAMFVGLGWVDRMSPHLGAFRASTDPAFTARFDNVNPGAGGGDACPAASLSDDFSAPLDGRWQAATNGSLSATGGELVVSLPPPGDTYALLGASTLYDLRGGALSLEIPQPFAASDTAQLVLGIYAMAGPTILFSSGAGQLVATEHVTSDVAVTARAFDPVAQRWWRIRETGGTVHWEISPDGHVYATIGTATDLVGLDRVLFQLRFTGSAKTAPLTAHIDNVNVP